MISDVFRGGIEVSVWNTIAAVDYLISGNKIKTESFAYVPLKTLNLIKANKKVGIKGADAYGESYKFDIRARWASLFSSL